MAGYTDMVKRNASNSRDVRREKPYKAKCDNDDDKMDIEAYFPWLNKRRQHFTPSALVEAMMPNCG